MVVRPAVETELGTSEDPFVPATVTVAVMNRTDPPGSSTASTTHGFARPGEGAGRPARPDADSSRVSRLARRLYPDAQTRRQLWQDTLVALAVVLVEVMLTRTAPGEFTGDPLQLRSGSWSALIGWYVAATVPIVLRRVAPWLGVGLAVGLIGVGFAIGHRPISSGVTFVTLTYTTAARFPLPRAVLAAALLWTPELIVAAALPQLAASAEVSQANLISLNVLVALVCFFIGRTVHARRASIRALEDRARTAEENQRALADQAVADERRRIARELHDVVAHHVSVMGVLATGARRVLSRDPAAADEALGTIEETSRTTLREMRRLLDVLRTDTEPAAELAPQPGLAGIEALVEQVREAGLPVTLRVDGVPTPLDPGVALTIYRIVQEALTNTLKHAGSATAQVRLSFGVYWLIVEIFDTGRGPSPDAGRSTGHGLVGMRERVALYGGTLRVGPRPGGGFRVYAKMPMEHLGAPVGDGTPRGEVGPCDEGAER